MFDRKAWEKEYRRKNKEKISQQQKEYRIKNKDKIKENAIKNKDKRRKWYKGYRKTNRDEILAKEREYKRKRYIQDFRYADSRKEYGRNRSRYIKNLWSKIIVPETNCKICGKKIYFGGAHIGKGNENDSIHFDHKTGNEPIKTSPTVFLSTHKPTPENIKIWFSCDFGMLCKKCNAFFPTLNREEFITNAYKYVFNL